MAPSLKQVKGGGGHSSVVQHLCIRMAVSWGFCLGAYVYVGEGGSNTLRFVFQHVLVWLRLEYCSVKSAPFSGAPDLSEAGCASRIQRLLF